MKLRAELLRRAAQDGGLEILDPLLQRVVRLDAAQAQALEQGVPGAGLEALLVLEGPTAEALRARAWGAALRGTLAPFTPEGHAHIDPAWTAALPGWVCPAWRDPERWRRLAEDRRAGRVLLRLDGFFDPEGLELSADRATWRRLDTALVHAWQGTPPEAVAALFGAPALRALLGAVLNLTLPAEVHVNAWRLEPGDHMGVHPDGPRYLATFSLGLCRGWTAADGGAIAFGRPGPDGLEVQERWLPQAGDLLVFTPHAESWHGVEPVANRTRLTLTGWYLG